MMHAMLAKLLDTEDFVISCLGNTNNIDRVLESQGPICCYLGDLVMHQIGVQIAKTG